MASKVIDIAGERDFNAKLVSAKGSLVVVDFSATWCGPCKFIKPVYDQFSMAYPDVLFLSVMESENEDLIHKLGVRGFPTFHFYINQQKVDELVGAQADTLKQSIETWRQQTFNPFSGGGMSLGSSGSNEDPREARLKRFAGTGGNTAEVELSEDEQLARAISLSQEAMPTVPAEADKKCEKMDCDDAVNDSSENSSQPPPPPVDEQLLNQLTDMGFPDLRCRKAILATNSGNLEGCISWLEEHQDDADIDEPIKYMDLSESTKKPLTAEEKEAKVQELKKKIEERKKIRQEEEKKQSFQSELQRREMGKMMGETREEINAMVRKREAEKLKKEKLESKLERERLRAQIALDKAERRAKYNYKAESTKTPQEAETEQKKVKRDLTPRESIQSNTEKLKKYRVGNDGLTAVKTLLVYVKNLINKPDEEKFRTINLENTAFKKRVAGLVGGVGFLKSIGYHRVDGEQTLHLSLEDKDVDLLHFSQETLERAVVELSN